MRKLILTDIIEVLLEIKKNKEEQYGDGINEYITRMLDENILDEKRKKQIIEKI